jgi:Tfp pilus assembly protein PilO
MNERLLLRLAAIDRRIVIGMLVFFVALAAFECWLLVLRTPLTELGNQTTMHADLAAANAGSADTAARIERLSGELPELEKAAAGGQNTHSDDGTILMLMDALGHLGNGHGVSLGSVKPGARRIVQGFEESIYDVEARGEYRQLYDWMCEAQKNVAPLVVTGFTLRSIDEGQRVALALKLADYRPVTVQGATP